MGREREAVEALRRRIVAAATRRFADAGYDATSIQQVAQDVGIGKTLVLYHFPSKDALRGEVLETVTAAWEAFLPRMVGALEAGSGLEDAIAPIVSFMREHPDLPRFVLRELIDSQGHLAEWMRARVGPTTEAAARLLAAAKGGDAAETHAEVLLSALMLLTVLAVFKPDANGRLTGPSPAADPDIGEHVLAVAIRAATQSLSSGGPAQGAARSLGGGPERR